MMHWRAIRRLVALIDDALTTDEAQHVRAHVAGCARCRHRLREYEAAEVLLRRMPRSLVPEQWSFAVQLRLRAIAGVPSPTGSVAADRIAFRAAAATASMALTLLLLTIGPLSVQRPGPRGWTGILPSAEKQSTLLAASFEPPGEWGRN